MQPKADNYDKLLNSDGLIDIQEFVKSSNITIGRSKFMQLLRDKKILFKEDRFNTKKNTPLQSFVDRDYFTVKQVIIPNGRYVSQTFITRKGLNWLMKKCGEWGLFKEAC